ncbi:AMP-binding protein [Amycolatopsis sp. FBCC-B4732]|uniref:AMP-binding protein n=1 Tax=Amycolatopsis sp. FBCC-B4732 TaxID=3079339 RepID=UPI001FF36567|nr:AMP-binding protein [Amycolatopsis sp. FBCC-B4732]UOX91753.1 AMP-binding protein [Amycolatopsis sp. FBCC-B4732]
MDQPFSGTTATLVDRARQHALGDLLRRTALRVPGKLAVIDGERRFTFAEFEAAAYRCAHALAARGLRRGDRLALLSHNCRQYAALAFATAKLGVLLVPVNFMLGADEIACLLRHAEVAA